MKKLMSVAESKRWKAAFWIAAVGVVMTLLCYSYLFYAIFISVLFGIVFFIKNLVLKWKARHHIEVTV
jgi:hypothetical protein